MISCKWVLFRRKNGDQNQKTKVCQNRHALSHLTLAEHLVLNRLLVGLVRLLIGLLGRCLLIRLLVGLLVRCLLIGLLVRLLRCCLLIWLLVGLLRRCLLIGLLVSRIPVSLF